MATIEIELNIEQRGSGYFTINPTLSGKTYKMTFSWSHRSLSWSFDIDDTLKGVKIVNGINLLEPYQYNDSLPPGKLGAVRNKGTESKPSFLNFGIDKENTLVYEEP